MLYFNASQQVRLSPAQVCAYRWIPAWPERHTIKGLSCSKVSSMASAVTWHIRLDMVALIWPMVMPFPSKSHRQSLSARLSYSQLSFHTELVPISRTVSFNICFHSALAFGLVKSTNTPGPPHQVPTPSSPLSLSFTRIPFAFIFSMSGWARRMPGFTLGDTVMPRFFISAKNCFGSLNRFWFQVNTQRLSPSFVSCWV